MKRIKLHLFSGILLVVLLTQCTPSFDTILAAAASEVNKSCPMMVDKETRLDNAVSFPGPTFQYNYTLVNYVKDSINADQLQKALQPGILNNVKSNPDLKIYRDHKVTMVYAYNDKNKVFITKINITPEMYGSN